MAKFKIHYGPAENEPRGAIYSAWGDVAHHSFTGDNLAVEIKCVEERDGEVVHTPMATFYNPRWVERLEDDDDD